MSESIVIVSAARTPMGAFQGDFSALSAHDLGGVAIKAAIERADALEGPDPAHHLDGGGSGGKDDEVGEVLAQVFR